MLCANKVSVHMQAAEGVKRAQRGGMLTGAMLIAVASLLTGATKLQRGIISAAASSREGGQITEDSLIWPIYAPIKVGHSAPRLNRTLPSMQADLTKTKHRPHLKAVLRCSARVYRNKFLHTTQCMLHLPHSHF